MYREEMATNTFETIEVTRSAGVVSITLNRPERKNAINQVMWDLTQHANKYGERPTLFLCFVPLLAHLRSWRGPRLASAGCYVGRFLRAN